MVRLAPFAPQQHGRVQASRMRMVRIRRHLEEPSSSNMISLKASGAPIQQVSGRDTGLDIPFLGALHLRLELSIFISPLVIIDRTIGNSFISDAIEFDERLLAGRVELIFRYRSGAFRVPRRRFLRLWRASPEAVAVR